MAESKIRQMVFSVPEGGEVITVFPQPLTLETVEMLEECYALMFRGMRRSALHAQAAADAEAEYASWFPLPPGVVVDHHQGPTPSDADAPKDRP